MSFAGQTAIGTQSPGQIYFVADDAAGDEFARRPEGVLRRG